MSSPSIFSASFGFFFVLAFLLLIFSDPISIFALACKVGPQNQGKAQHEKTREEEEEKEEEEEEEEEPVEGEGV